MDEFDPLNARPRFAPADILLLALIVVVAVSALWLGLSLGATP